MPNQDLLHLFSDPNLIPYPLQDLIRRVSIQSNELGMTSYLVGGFVRDLLLKQRIIDFDIVVEGDAIKLGKSLLKDFGGKLTKHAKFKTATWFLVTPIAGVEFLDLITARSETYSHPGALPTITPSTIDDDLHRRDFTINAIAMQIDPDHFGELIDPLNGQEDLAKGLIRVLHMRSFLDDPTRMLRAIRYEKRYDFQIEAKTLHLFNDEAASVLSQLSGERIRHEFDLMFDDTSSSSMLARVAELGLLRHIHATLTWNKEIQARFSRVSENNLPASRAYFWIIWLMSLSQSEIKSLGKRLHFTADTLRNVLAASSIFHDLDSFAGMKPSQCVEQLENLPDEAIFAVSRSIPHGKPREMLETYLTKWKHIRPHTTGSDLKTRGIPPGPKYGEVLRRLRAAWLDGEVRSTEEEIKLLETLLQNAA